MVVIDLEKNTVVGEITNTPGVHGLAVAPDLARGFVSCGREDKAAIVDLKTLQTISKVETGKTLTGCFMIRPRRRSICLTARRIRHSD